MNWTDDPRVAPHLQMLCDVGFAHMQNLFARTGGVKLPLVPFDEIPVQDAGERLRAAIAECIGLTFFGSENTNGGS